MANVTLRLPVDFVSIDLSRSGAASLPNSADYTFLTPANRVLVEGESFTLDAFGNLASGAIRRAGINVNDTSALTSSLNADVTIRERVTEPDITDPEDLQAIDDGANSFFSILLDGQDFFLLPFDQDADGATLGTSVIFGDDLETRIGAFDDVDEGGNDFFDIGNNDLRLAGDVWSHNLTNEDRFTFGGADGIELIEPTRTYNGGDDSIENITFPTLSTAEVQVSGDAWLVETGTNALTGFLILNGGDDAINLSGNRDVINEFPESLLAGDVYHLTARRAVVRGGDDFLRAPTSFRDPEVSGDVFIVSDGGVVGGNDLISAPLTSKIAGDVFLYEFSFDDVVGGNDEIYGGSFGDVIAGDIYESTDADPFVDIIGGDDTIFGGDGSDVLYGEIAIGSLTNVSGGNDVMFGGVGVDFLAGQTGDDTLDGGRSRDTLDGGDGNDTASYATARGGVSISLGVTGQQGDGIDGGDTLISIENLVGSPYGDTLTGSSGEPNVIDGLAGDDSLVAVGAFDLLIGGSGDDTLDVGGAPNSTAFGGSGDDWVRSSGDGRNTLIGGEGTDTAVYLQTNDDVAVNLTAGIAFLIGPFLPGTEPGDTLAQFENVQSGPGDDALVGDDGANNLQAGDGNDRINGLAGDDTLGGQAGDDTLDGGDGDDLIQSSVGDDLARGGDGDDLIRGQAGDDTLRGNAGDDVLFGNEGDDTLLGDEGDDALHGLDDDDNVRGGVGDDRVDGGDGDDRLDGEAGEDTVSGGDGNDVLRGGDGRDTLTGGDGADTYIGGPDADRLVFAPSAGTVRDIIVAFDDRSALSDDVIDVAAYGFAAALAITATPSGDNVLLDLGQGDTILVIDYLVMNTIDDLGPDDFLI